MGRFGVETRQWNGKILDNDYSGDAAATILLERLALPCILLCSIVYLNIVIQNIPSGSLGFDVVSVLAVVPVAIICGFFLATGLGISLAVFGALVAGMWFIFWDAIGVWFD